MAGPADIRTGSSHEPATTHGCTRPRRGARTQCHSTRWLQRHQEHRRCLPIASETVCDIQRVSRSAKDRFRGGRSTLRLGSKATAWQLSLKRLRAIIICTRSREREREKHNFPGAKSRPPAPSEAGASGSRDPCTSYPRRLSAGVDEDARVLRAQSCGMPTFSHARARAFNACWREAAGPPISSWHWAARPDRAAHPRS